MQDTGQARSYKKAWIVSIMLLFIAIALAAYSGLSHAGTTSGGPVQPAVGASPATLPPGGPSIAGTPLADFSPTATVTATASPGVATTMTTPSPTPAPRRVSGPGVTPPPSNPIAGSASPNVPAPPTPSPSVSPVAAIPPSPTPSPTGCPAVTTNDTSSAMVQQRGITDGQMATSLAADGSAANPHLTFCSLTDPKIIAVVTLQNLGPGTTISYVHIHGTSYTPSQTYTLNKSLNHFYVQFAAPSGKALTPGHDGLRFYVNGQAAWEITYDIQ